MHRDSGGLTTEEGDFDTGIKITAIYVLCHDSGGASLKLESGATIPLESNSLIILKSRSLGFEIDATKQTGQTFLLYTKISGPKDAEKQI